MQQARSSLRRAFALSFTSTAAQLLAAQLQPPGSSGGASSSASAAVGAALPGASPLPCLAALSTGPSQQLLAKLHYQQQQQQQRQGSPATAAAGANSGQPNTSAAAAAAAAGAGAALSQLDMRYVQECIACTAEEISNTVLSSNFDTEQAMGFLKSCSSSSKVRCFKFCGMLGHQNQQISIMQQHMPFAAGHNEVIDS
jgi:hypothetical protein